MSNENQRSIPTPKPSDLPAYKIMLGGSEMNREYKVTTIEVVKVFNKVSYARVVLIDGDAAKEEFTISNTEDLKPGAEIEIHAGYHSEFEVIFKGIILSHSVRIHSGGKSPSQLVIEARDKAVKLTASRKSAYYYKMSDSEIIEQLAGDGGLEKDVESTSQKHEEMVQFYSSPWDFILSRAEMNGMLVLADDNKLIVKKPDTSTATVLQLEHGATIMEFEADMNAETQVKSVKSSAWNYSELEIVESEGSNPSVTENGNITADTLAGVLGIENFSLTHSGKFEEAELKSWSDAQIVKNKLARICGHVKFQGSALVKPGVMLELKGVGDRFNGNVFVSGVRQTLSLKNWTTDAQFGFNNRWFHDSHRIASAKATGMVPGINGLQVAVVTKLEGDPQGEHRIQVKMPLLDNAAEGTWVRIATLDAGDTRGSFFRPEIGDEVILGFINDDPRNPVMLGMMNSKKKAAPLEAADDNDQKGFITRSQIRMLFDDKKKSFTVETPAGKTMIIDDDAGEITVKDENNNKIVLSADGIVIESGKDIKMKATGDITMEGKNITAKASASLTAEGGSGAEFKSGGNTVLKGSTVAIN
ncbi:MAG: type VI secretion system tip protein VgrG [Bacteroidota bacterium]|nr:type VI secretion system tip protein VgrG [Bacteroidota bacterium]